MAAKIAQGRKADEARRALRCPRCGAALALDRRTLALAALEPSPGQAFDARVSGLLDQVLTVTEDQGP